MRHFVRFIHAKHAALHHRVLVEPGYAEPGVYPALTVVVELDDVASAVRKARAELGDIDGELLPTIVLNEDEVRDRLRRPVVDERGAGLYVALFFPRAVAERTAAALENGGPIEPLQRSVSVAVQAEGTREALELAEQKLEWPHHEPDLVPLTVMSIHDYQRRAREADLNMDPDVRTRETA